MMEDLGMFIFAAVMIFLFWGDPDIHDRLTGQDVCAIAKEQGND